MPRRSSIRSGHVFINCPFDDHYDPIFQAIVFAVHDCGFLARCAREAEDSGEVRLGKIVKIIEECGLAIHDLSRVQVSAPSGLPRFNMPFELGLFLGAKHLGAGEHRGKACLILDSEPYRYQQFLSDIGGQDIRSHSDRPDEAIRAIRNWLVTKVDHLMIPSGSVIDRRYQLFRAELPAICDKLRLTEAELEYVEYQRILTTWLEDNTTPADVD